MSVDLDALDGVFAAPSRRVAAPVVGPPIPGAAPVPMAAPVPVAPPVPMAARVPMAAPVPPRAPLVEPAPARSGYARARWPAVAAGVALLAVGAWGLAVFVPGSPEGPPPAGSVAARTAGAPTPAVIPATAPTASAPTAAVLAAEPAPASTPAPPPPAPAASDAPAWVVPFAWTATEVGVLAPPATLRGCAALRVVGHTCSLGDPAANRAVGLARAEAVRDALVAAGVPAARITVTSAGEDAPVASNTTPDGRARNRRVETFCTPETP